MASPLLKDLIDFPLVSAIAEACVRHLPAESAFTADDFIARVHAGQLEQLELKARIRLVATALFESIQLPFEQSCHLLMAVSSQFTGIPGFIFPEVVEQFGLEHPTEALQALAHFTRFSTSEFAIRPFLQRYPAQTLTQLQHWAIQDDEHLRRLASEGCRPRLPWGQALTEFKKDPAPILPILWQLRQDASPYVQRSVANNLNDISKDHPDLVLNIAKQWLGTHPSTDWIVKHALRGLLKQQHPAALHLFGYQNLNPSCTLELQHHTISLGEALAFEVTLEFSAPAGGKIRLEYALEFASKQGKLRRKVFHWLEQQQQEPKIQLQRKYWFKDLTTRKHYAGPHRLSIILNGTILATAQFAVIDAKAPAA